MSKQFKKGYLLIVLNYRPLSLVLNSVRSPNKLVALIAETVMAYVTELTAYKSRFDYILTNLHVFWTKMKCQLSVPISECRVSPKIVRR